MKRFGPGLLVGGLFYFAYGLANSAFLTLGLIFVSILMIFTAPVFARVSNVIDVTARERLGSVLVGRLARLGFQWLVNLILIGILMMTGVLSAIGLAGLGGLLWAAFFATVASQGLQHLAVSLAARGTGTAEVNVLFALSGSLLLSAFALSGIIWLQWILIALGYGLTAAGFLSAAWMDIRKYSNPPA